MQMFYIFLSLHQFYRFLIWRISQEQLFLTCSKAGFSDYNFAKTICMYVYQ